MSTDREDVSDCVCRCGAELCRGTYVKRHVPKHSTSLLIPIKKIFKGKKPTTATQADYKVLKFCIFLMATNSSSDLMTWTNVGKRKHIAKSMLTSHGHSNISVDYIIGYLQKNMIRIKYILKSHGKVLKFSETQGFACTPLNKK